MITFLISLEDGEYVVRMDGDLETRYPSAGRLLSELPRRLQTVLEDSQDLEVIWEEDDP